MNDNSNKPVQPLKSVTFKIIKTGQSQPESKKIYVIIEKSKDGYSAYAVNTEGVAGVGDTIEACKQNVYDCIKTIRTFDEKNIPEILKGNYEVVFQVKADQTIN